MDDEERVTRNLVLSVCEFRLRTAGGEATTETQHQLQQQTGPPGGRVGSQILLLGGTTPAAVSNFSSSVLLLLHGGADHLRCYDDLHAVELQKGLWRELNVGGFSKPRGVYGHSATSLEDKIFFFGGLSQASFSEQVSTEHVSYYPPPPFLENEDAQWLHNPQPSNDLFILDVEKLVWIHPTTDGVAPQPRAFHSATICDNFLVIFGGAIDARLRQATNDLYLMDCERMIWHKAPTSSGKRSRSSDSSGISSRGLKHISEGGEEGDEDDEYVDENLNSDEEEHEEIFWQIFGQTPSPRIGHQMVTVKPSQQILLFGGCEDSCLYGLNLHLKTFQNKKTYQLHWKQIHTKQTSPISRAFFNFANIANTRLFVFGGMPIGTAAPADLYVLQLKHLRWQKPLFEGHLSLRGAAAAVLHDKLVVFGGARSSQQQQQQQQKDPEQQGRQPEQQEEVQKPNGRPLHAEERGPPTDTSSCVTENPEKTCEEQQQSTLSVMKVKRLNKKLYFLNVLELKEGSADSEFKFKLVTVGDSGVGKSCLLMRFSQDDYTDFHVSTIGVDFKAVLAMVKGKVCTLQLWDTAGQERFSGVTGNYYRNADCFILVFDVTRMSSFLHIDNWIRQIKEHHDFGPNTLALLIGNKADLTTEVEVSEQTARQLADRLGAIYVATSAKTSANVDAAFLSIAGKLVEMRRKASMAAAAAAIASSSAAPNTSGQLSQAQQPQQREGAVQLEQEGRSLQQQQANRRGSCLGSTNCWGGRNFSSAAAPVEQQLQSIDRQHLRDQHLQQQQQLRQQQVQQHRNYSRG